MATILKESFQFSLSRSLDQQFLAQIAQGDIEVFEQLYNQYSKPIYHYLVHLIFDEDVAEDLIQEVFVAAWKGARRFRGQASAKTWLFQIAHHQAVTWLRRNKLKARYSDWEVNDPVKNIEEKFYDSWVNEQVQTALKELSVDHRAVIELVFFQGMSYQETATVMRCPVGTIKSRMSYARRYLDASLKSLKIDSLEGST